MMSHFLFMDLYPANRLIVRPFTALADLFLVLGVVRSVCWSVEHVPICPPTVQLQKRRGASAKATLFLSRADGVSTAVSRPHGTQHNRTETNHPAVASFEGAKTFVRVQQLRRQTNTSATLLDSKEMRAETPANGQMRDRYTRCVYYYYYYYCCCCCCCYYYYYYY